MGMNSAMASCIWFRERWYLRWNSLWRDRTSLKALCRLSIDFTCMRPTTQEWSRLGELLSVNWTTWQTVARAIMLTLWKSFSSILPVPCSLDLCYIQILGLRRCCYNNFRTMYVYCAIYASSLRNCCISFSIIVRGLVSWLWSPSRVSKKRFFF